MLALVAFVLAHDAIYLATYGSSYDAVLARTGHGGRWEATVATALVLAALLVGASLARLLFLVRATRQLNDEAIPRAGWNPRFFLREVRDALPLVFVGALTLFVVAENLERVSAGLAAPGLSVLGSQGYVGTIPILAAVSLVVSLVEALYRWRRDDLIARIAAAVRARRLRSVGPVARRFGPWSNPRLRSIAGHHVAGRAPPVAAA